jgi:thiazole tautomerase (transcriptional regulator TenI)
VYEAIEVDQETVDFFLVGTIFGSLSHPGAKTGGVERIREVRGRTDLPLFAIGGMTPGGVEAVLAAGARGVAVRGGVWDSRDPAEATRAYVAELKKGEG